MFWNTGSEQITGYKKDEVLHSYCFDNILDHVDGKGNHLCQDGCPLLDTIRTGKEKEAEVFLTHKQGHRVPVTVRTTPMYGPDGEIVGAIEAFTDNRFKENLYSENKRLQEMLVTDELTKISNRRYLEFQLKKAYDEYMEFGYQFGILFIDIDHFKDVNDTYGHDIGDEVLKLVANTINANVRKNDVFGRWGGEEFLLVANHITIEQLRTLAEKLRVLVEHSAVPLNDTEMVQVTISIGGSICTSNSTINECIRKADENMYHAKQNGRNQTYIK